TLAGGGAERVAVELIRRLDRSSFDVAACVTREPGLSASDIAALGVPVHILSRKSRFDVEGFSRLMKLLRQFAPHVLHTHKEGSNTLGRIAGLLTQVPVLLAHEHCLPDHRRVQRLADCVLARLGTRVLACSRAVLSQQTIKQCIPPSRIRVVPNGIDVDVFNPAETLKVARGELRLPEGPLVGAIARLDADKDIATLLSAVPGTLRSIPNVQFVIAG